MADPPPGEGGRGSEQPRMETAANEKPGRFRRCMRTTWSLAVPLFGVVLALVGYEITKTNLVRIGLLSGANPYDMLAPDIPDDLKSMFMGYDVDLDGYLSLEEFEYIYPYLTGEQKPGHLAMNQTKLTNYSADHEVILLTAHFQPLQVETMAKAEDKFGPGFGSPVFIGLKSWTNPTHNISALSVDFFAPLIRNMPMTTGTVWTLLEPSTMQQFRGLSSTRIYPPTPLTPVEDVLFKLLSHFHPRPFLAARFGPFGCKAIVMAENDQFVDVLIRLHSEFQLSMPPQLAYWFTPGQFLIRMVISRVGRHIEYFHLHVPTDKALNIDMEWMTSAGSMENMEVDIGYMPQMELRMHSPSFQPPSPDIVTVIDEMENTTSEVFELKDAATLKDMYPEVAVDPGAIQWKNSIPMAVALRQLEVEFFDFKKVPYLPFLDAFKLAQVENKMVHLILLWGVLDDQSC